MDVTSLAMPDIASMSTAMAQNKVQTEVGTALLAKSLDTFEAQGASMVKAMELSVNPGVGGNLDLNI